LRTCGENVNYLLTLFGYEVGKRNRRYKQKGQEKIWEEAWKDFEVGEG
jgi:hypothetical protein